jgi:hypothetical protein
MFHANTSIKSLLFIVLAGKSSNLMFLVIRCIRLMQHI